MDANDIRIGTKLEIEIPEFNRNKDKDQITTTYISQLVDVINAKTLSVVSPMSEGRLKFLTKGVTVVIYFLNERQELLYFKGIVLGHRKNGPLDLFDIAVSGEFNKIQRRRFYRLDVVLNCKYRVAEQQLISTDKLEFENIDDAAMKTGYTRNISGSGFCLLLEESYDSGTVMDISINLEDSATIRVFAQVIRSTGVESKKYGVGLHYIKIAPRDSDILTRYIFEKQRQILKNTMQAKLK